MTDPRRSAQDVSDGTVTVRRYGIEAQETMGLDAYHTMLREEIMLRKHVRGS